MNSPTPTAPVSPAKVAASVAPVAQLLALDQVAADPDQPRKTFEEGALKELADSIRTEGLLVPIIVKPNGKGFHIVDGERRYRAAKILGLKEVPVLVRADLKDKDVTTQQLTANLQREDLTLPEQCEAVTKLVKVLGTAKAAAEKLGKSEAWVSKRANAHKLPPEVRKLLTDGKLVDIELAAGLGELREVEALRDKEDDDYRQTCFKDLIDDIKHGSTSSGEPVTRDLLRDAVRDEKEAQAQFKEAKDLASQNAARAKAAKDAGKPIPKDLRDPEPYVRKVSEAERRAGRVAGDRKALRDAVDAALYQGLKLTKKNFWNPPVRLQYVEAASDWSKFPKAAEACHFSFESIGDVALLKKLASGLPGKVIVKVDEMKVSLDDAQRINDALKSSPHLKDLRLSFEHRVSGADLRSCITKLTPDLVGTLPLTRAEKEAGKKNPAAATAKAKAPKKAAKKKR